MYKKTTDSHFRETKCLYTKYSNELVNYRESCFTKVYNNLCISVIKTRNLQFTYHNDKAFTHKKGMIEQKH
jgi:hypothetical protein